MSKHGLAGKRSRALITCAAIAICGPAVGWAQMPGPSLDFEYETYAFRQLDGPPAGAEEAEIGLSCFTIAAGYPMIFSQGRTFLQHRLQFERLDVDYRGWREAGVPEPAFDKIYRVDYSLFLRHGLSPKWTLLSFASPGLASDFESDLSLDDFVFQIGAIFVRKYSESFSLGYGLMYSTIFGEPFPIPILSFDWQIDPAWKLSGPFPVELWYSPGAKLQLGLLAMFDGNQYHGDPDIYGVANPELNYSVGSVGPAMRWQAAPSLQIRVEGGWTFLRRFEFSDGGDKIQEDDLENSPVLRVGVQLGG